MLASDRRLPIYLRIQDALAAELAAGKWRPGEAIPAEEALAKRFGAAVGTARKAIEGLVAQGRLERRQGRGTFVRRADFGNMLFRFFRHTNADGTPLRPTAKLLARRKGKADAATARRLAIPLGTATIELFRLRLVEGAPMLAEEIVVPHRRFAPLLDLAKDAFGSIRATKRRAARSWPRRASICASARRPRTSPRRCARRPKRPSPSSSARCSPPTGSRSNSASPTAPPSASATRST
jgi:GntR family transcriptional regulator